MKDLPADRIAMPSFFIGGDRDVVVASNPAAVDAMQAVLPDFRGAVLLPGIGHWTQQEAPEAFNEALLGFLATSSRSSSVRGRPPVRGGRGR